MCVSIIGKHKNGTFKKRYVVSTIYIMLFCEEKQRPLNRQVRRHNERHENVKSLDENYRHIVSHIVCATKFTFL